MDEKKSTQKIVSLSTSWKNHVLGYILSVLLIPLFGIGLVLLYWVQKKHKKHRYRFSDTHVTSRDDKYQRNIDLVNIEKVEVQQDWIQEKMDVGDITLHTSASSMTLLGLEMPHKLKDLLEKAIYDQKERLKQEKANKPDKPDHKPGTKERMDYLTGLWQQGLVSDEDFKKERKHFE
ncbi:PH domain-containing protein [Fodinibius halophilus]|uniref:PH domain-containing protein n=1 Tax=Fodinibius halophilus TaxID=1736908 RepID=A0A6M1TEG7_9BACT|nr:PH domain-containing protein [Fodinibius halophilus]NGP88572.1 PH domain-containing protein [Fodinibius halophilus]